MLLGTLGSNRTRQVMGCRHCSNAGFRARHARHTRLHSISLGPQAWSCANGCNSQPVLTRLHTSLKHGFHCSIRTQGSGVRAGHLRRPNARSKILVGVASSPGTPIQASNHPSFSHPRYLPVPRNLGYQAKTPRDFKTSRPTTKRATPALLHFTESSQKSGHQHVPAPFQILG